MEDFVWLFYQVLEAHYQSFLHRKKYTLDLTYREWKMMEKFAIFIYKDYSNALDYQWISKYFQIAFFRIKNRDYPFQKPPINWICGETAWEYYLKNYSDLFYKSRILIHKKQLVPDLMKFERKHRIAPVKLEDEYRGVFSKSPNALALCITNDLRFNIKSSFCRTCIFALDCKSIKNHVEEKASEGKTFKKYKHLERLRQLKAV